MGDSGLTGIIGMMLVAGGPQEQPAGIRWPMHLALREFFAASRRCGEADVQAIRPALRPSPDLGLEVLGANDGLEALVCRGVLERKGTLRDARLTVRHEATSLLRRQFMALTPRQASLIQRAGARWAALACTTSKKSSTALRSSDSTVRSSTPNRA